MPANLAAFVLYPIAEKRGFSYIGTEKDFNMNTKPKTKKSVSLAIVVSCLLVILTLALIAARTTATQTWGSKQFQEVWNGFGSTSWSNYTLTLIPKAPTQPSETHSALVEQNLAQATLSRSVQPHNLSSIAPKLSPEPMGSGLVCLWLQTGWKI